MKSIHQSILRFHVFLLFFSHLIAHGQKLGLRTELRGKQDSTYVQRFPDRVIVKLDVDNDYDRYHLKGNNFNYDIRPNAGMAKLLSFNYRFAYVAISYLPRFISKNKWDNQRGKTSGIGYGFGLSGPHWVADISLRSVKGFYLYNTQDYVSGWNKDVDPYIQFPDLKTFMIRGTVFYKINPNFSIRAIQTQTEAQRKSAKSFIPGIAYNYYIIDDKSATSTSSQKSNNAELLLQLNYYGTYVYRKRWYISGGAGVAAGAYYSWLLTRLPSGDIHSTNSSAIMRGIFNAGMGYNGSRFIAGAEILHYQSLSHQANGQVSMVFTRTAYQIFVGYRVKAPRIVDRTMDKLEQPFRF